MELSKVINKDLIIFNSESLNKNEAIDEICTQLYQKGYLLDKELFMNDVFDRENEGMTGIGLGVAIPHGKSSAVNKTTVAISKLSSSIDWETLDGNPVEIIILFAVRDLDKTTTHIKLLQKVAILLAQENFIAKLKKAKDKESLYKLFLNF